MQQSQRSRRVAIPRPENAGGGMFTRLSSVHVALVREGFEVLFWVVDTQRGDAPYNEFFRFTGKPKNSEAQAFARWCSEQHISAVFSFNSRHVQLAFKYIKSDSCLRICVANNVHFPGFYNTALGIWHSDALVSYPGPMEEQLSCLTRYYGVTIFVEDPYIKPPEIMATAREIEIDDKIRLIFVGRLEQTQKNISFLNQLYFKLECAGVHFHMDIVGDGPDRRLLSEIAGCQNVTMHGWLDALARDNLLAISDISLAPSFSEGFGVAIIEAAMSGVVPFCNDLPHKETLFGNTRYFISVDNVDAWTREITHLSENRDLLEQLKGQYRSDAISRFGSFDVFSGFYARVASARPPRPRSSAQRALRRLCGLIDYLPVAVKWRLLRLAYTNVDTAK